MFLLKYDEFTLKLDEYELEDIDAEELFDLFAEGDHSVGGMDAFSSEDFSLVSRASVQTNSTHMGGVAQMVENSGNAL